MIRVIQIVKKKQPKLSVASTLAVSHLFLIKIYDQNNKKTKGVWVTVVIWNHLCCIGVKSRGSRGVRVRARWAGQLVTVRSCWPRRGQLPGLPKEGSQAWAFCCCLQSSQRPPAQEFTFHSPGFSSYGGEATQLKRRLFFFFFLSASFFFFLIFWFN